MVEIVGLLVMILTGLAFVPLFRWLGRHYDGVEKAKKAETASEPSTKSSRKNRDLTLN